MWSKLYWQIFGRFKYFISSFVFALTAEIRFSGARSQKHIFELALRYNPGWSSVGVCYVGAGYCGQNEDQPTTCSTETLLCVCVRVCLCAHMHLWVYYLTGSYWSRWIFFTAVKFKRPNESKEICSLEVLLFHHCLLSQHCLVRLSVH